VALATAFVITQFDPATSAISYHKAHPRLNVFFVATSLLATLMGSAFLVVRWRQLAFRELTNLDCIVTGVVVFSIALSQGAKQFLGAGMNGADLLASAKMGSYLLIWFPVTRVYSEMVWEIGRKPSGWMERLVDNRWVGTVGVFCLLCIPAVLSGAYRTGAVIYHYSTGKKLLESRTLVAAKRHYDMARQFNTVVDLRPVRDRILEDLALLYLEQGNDWAAEQVIRELRGTIYDEATANRKSADTYFRAKKWAQAASGYRVYLEKAGKNAEVLDRLGKAYLQLRDSRGFVEIAEAFKYIPSVEPNTYEENVFLGNVHGFLRELDAALQNFEAALKIKPKDAYSTYKIGMTFLAQDKYAAASDQFHKAAQLEPNFPDAYYQMGVCFELQGRPKAAMEMYRKTVDLLPNHLDGLSALKRISE
jgi:tetratricopeptide (TPR) repeat protein